MSSFRGHEHRLSRAFSSVVEEGEERARLETTSSTDGESTEDAGCPFPHGDAS